MESKRIIRLVLIVAALLLIPLIAMQFNNGVNWTLSDFVIMGGLLLGVGLIYELIVHKIQNSNHKVIAGLILLLSFLLIWAELAVGIFGSPFAGS